MDAPGREHSRSPPPGHPLSMTRGKIASEAGPVLFPEATRIQVT